VIEMFDADIERLVNCFDSFLEQGWEKTRELYHEDPRIAFGYYLDFAKTYLLNEYDYYGFCVSLRHVVDRYGWQPDLEAALKEVARKVLGQPATDREISPDHLLQRLTRPARALSTGLSWIGGYDFPHSLRAETCVLPLRRGKPELEQILAGTSDISVDDPAYSQLIEALTDKAPEDSIAFLQGKYPEVKWPRLARILALMQQAQYSEARQELLQWKQTAVSWDSQLEEILGDLNWLHGYHARALASYREALQKRPNNPRLQEKIHRLLVRNGANLVIKKPEAQLKDLGLAFHTVEPTNSISITAFMQTRLQIADYFDLETTFLTTTENNPKAWSLVGSEDVQRAGFQFSFQYSKRSPDCKEFIEAAVDWADKKGKIWIGLACLDSIITFPFLQQLQDWLVHSPIALIFDRWDVAFSPNGTALNIPRNQQLTPALILMRVDWWKKNNWRFRRYRLQGVNWMALYAIKILRLTKAAYLCDPEQRLPTIQAESPPVSKLQRWKRLVPLLKGDLDAVIRLKLIELYCKHTNLDLNHEQGKTELLIDHFIRSNVLKAFLLVLAGKVH